MGEYLGSDMLERNEAEIEKLVRKAKIHQKPFFMELLRDDIGLSGYQSIYNYVVVYPNGRKLFLINPPKEA